jgi:CPA2 family monovalent cation:H+ antiporter-2
MLFNPMVVLQHPWELLATVLIIVIGKSLAAYLIVGAVGHSHGTAATIAASLAQIGEFSFILAGLGVTLDVMPTMGRDLILAGAIVSIMLNPMLFSGLEHIKAWSGIFAAKPCIGPTQTMPFMLNEPTLTGHAVIVGYQNPGISVARALIARGIPIYIIEEREANLTNLGRQLYEAVTEGFAHFGPASGASFTTAGALILSTNVQPKVDELATAAVTANPAIKLVGFAADSEQHENLQEKGAQLIISAETDQTSAASQIADFLTEDDFAHAQRGTYNPNR